MSVFTPIERDELETFLAGYGLGRLKGYRGIAAGSENSNFFVSLDGGEFVLTLIERGPLGDLPFFIELLDVLHEAGLPVPYALRAADGEALRRLKGKPALLQPRLPGAHVEQATAAHCLQVGELLAHIHLATRGPLLERRSDRGLDWMLREGPPQVARLPADQRPALESALAEMGAQREALCALPRANLHADLFRDNLMFEDGRLSGVIDFYNACSGPMLYDVAIALNDWCSTDAGALDPVRAQPLLAAYAALRPFSAAERRLWPTLLRVACVRFWLSRAIAAQAFAGQDVLIHDPETFRRCLEWRQRVEVELPPG